MNKGGLGEGSSMKRKTVRALLEVSFIIFLFYANLMMGEFTRSGVGSRLGWRAATVNTFTPTNLAIGVLAAVAGYFVVESLRDRF
jgi:hypothetical protein